MNRVRGRRSTASRSAAGHTSFIVSSDTSHAPLPGSSGHWPSIGREPVVASIVAMLGGAGRARQALVRAPLGGGKSRCLDDVAEALEARQRPVRRIQASLSLQTVPFGAVAHLLPAGARQTGDPVTLIGARLSAVAGVERASLLEADGRILARDYLFDRVWGEQAESADRTVDTHIKTLRAKLRGVDAQRDFITTHRGMGYSLDL